MNTMMNRWFIRILSLLMLITVNGFSQEAKIKLSISPAIDTSTKVNQDIIETLAQFLQTKNQSYSENQFWSSADFKKYQYPYLDIYQLEQSLLGANFYQPSLMEILPTDNPQRKILKIAFVGHNPETKDTQLKAIYNLIANVAHNSITLSRYLDEITTHWNTQTNQSITYKFSPNRQPNAKEIRQQENEIQTLVKFLGCKPVPITYYSCKNPKEVFEIKGFDYHPMMYVDTQGGLADYGNLIFSGMDSEVYTHEITHIYLMKLFPEIHDFFNEGFATYWAGSGKYDYQWHKQKVKLFLKEHPDYDFSKNMNVFSRIYYQKETSIPYLTAALVVERTLRLYGKALLFDLFKLRDEDLWNNLSKVGLTPQNINRELRKELEH